MKTTTRAILLPAFAITFALVSCAKVSQLSEMAVNRIRPAGVKVVEVRAKDLKELPSGQERALAFESSRKRGYWFFSGPVDFKEPTLPQPGGEMDGSLLPPKIP